MHALADDVQQRFPPRRLTLQVAFCCDPDVLTFLAKSSGRDWKDHVPAVVIASTKGQRCQEVDRETVWPVHE